MTKRKPVSKSTVVKLAVTVTVGSWIGCNLFSSPAKSTPATQYETFAVYDEWTLPVLPVAEIEPTPVPEYPVESVPDETADIPETMSKPLAIIQEDIPPQVPELKPLALLYVTEGCAACKVQKLKIAGIEAMGYRVEIEDDADSPMTDGLYPVWKYEVPGSRTGWKMSHDAITIGADLLMQEILKQEKSGTAGAVPLSPSTSVPASRTQYCQCNGDRRNEHLCLCLKAGMACHCTPNKVSQHFVDSNGRSLGKTGQYANPNRTF